MIDYVYAYVVLGALLTFALLLSVFLKKTQKKLQKKGDLSIKDSILIDPKRRVLLLETKESQFLYVVGPHNDTVIPLGALLETSRQQSSKGDDAKIHLSHVSVPSSMGDPKLSIPPLKIVGDADPV
jgi:flagellar biogenesis protein FliO